MYYVSTIETSKHRPKIILATTKEKAHSITHFTHFNDEVPFFLLQCLSIEKHPADRTAEKTYFRKK